MAAVLGHVADMFHLQHRFVYNRITDAVFNHPENVVYSSDSVAKLFGKDALKPQQPIILKRVISQAAKLGEQYFQSSCR